MKSDRRACATARPPLAQSPPAALLRGFFFRSESIKPLRERSSCARFERLRTSLRARRSYITTCRNFKRGAGLDGPAPPIRPAPRRSPRSESILFINRIFGFGTLSQKIAFSDIRRSGECALRAPSRVPKQIFWAEGSASYQI